MYFHVTLCGGRLPTRGSGDAVGYDLYAPKGGFVDPFERVLVTLGIKTEFSPGWVGKLFDRSGMWKKHGIISSAGVIDPDYRGEWGVVLYNTGREVFRWAADDRLCQVVFLPVGLPEVSLVSSLSATSRGEGGYGSTGN